MNIDEAGTGVTAMHNVHHGLADWSQYKASVLLNTHLELEYSSSPLSLSLTRVLCQGVGDSIVFVRRFHPFNIVHSH